MTKQTEALRMAIEFMKTLTIDVGIKTWNEKHRKDAIQAIEEALAQPTAEQSSLVQEPVYAIVVDRYIQYDIDTGLLEIYNSKEEAEKNTFKGAKIKAIDISINPAPSREWVGLSDEEISELWFKLEHEIGTHISYGAKLARAIEMKLREKNNGT